MSTSKEEEADFVKNKRTVCLENPSRITPLQSSLVQCELRSAVHFFRVFSDAFSRKIMIYPLRSSSLCLQVQKFKMQVHSFSANPFRVGGSDPNPRVINPKMKDSCSRFQVRNGSGIEATASEGTDTGSAPHPIALK
ncbi:hypothetical protein OPV22_007529 [Ensete ventricosum]|uniref:Uncharacterized protein n=1 Tax=Ensete ventricosum TaxID=4639 RepID=A0AAV8RLF5_ENSVE|nr:hypothetical protein OPV22_007529 [Ensete ventricosum]